MENRTYYYARVSTTTQKVDRQIDRFKDLGAEDNNIIIDKESGKDLNRTGYLYLKNNLLREGDTLFITSLDRLSRNKACK
jgi:DNA invertase Pin-like site-specific DNA recombinase